MLKSAYTFLMHCLFATVKYSDIILYKVPILLFHFETSEWQPVIVGRDGALVESIAFNRRVVDSTPALAVT